MVDAGGIASNQQVPSAPVDTGRGRFALVLALSGEAFDLDRARREHLADGRLQLNQDITKARQKESYRRLVAPVDGCRLRSRPVTAG